MRALLAVALCLLLVPAAAASDELPATDGLFIRAARDADAYWEKRGHVFTGPAVVLTTDEGAAAGFDAWGDIGGDTILWVRAYMADVRFKLAHGSRADRAWLLAQVLTVAIHERGHNLGLDHSADPRDVMHFEPRIPPMARRWGRLVAAES